MTDLTIFKKGVYKAYLFNGLIGGLILGLLFFLISLFQNNATIAFKTGFLPMFICTIVLFAFGFLHEEWFKRKQSIKRLLSDKYSSLRQLGFYLDNDLYYVNILDNLYIRFHSYQKLVQVSRYKHHYQDKHSVEIYCIPRNFESLSQVIQSTKQKKGVQNAAWAYGIFSILLCDDFADFSDIVISTIDLLKQNNFAALTIENWNTSFGNELKSDIRKEEEKRNFQLFKWRKIDIKYQKPIK